MFKKLLAAALSSAMLFGMEAALPEGVTETFEITASADEFVSGDYECTLFEDGTVRIECMSGSPAEQYAIENGFFYNRLDVELSEHSYTSQLEKAPTCTEHGLMRYTCSDCSDLYYEPIYKGHNFDTAGFVWYCNGKESESGSVIASSEDEEPWVECRFRAVCSDSGNILRRMSQKLPARKTAATAL